MSTKHTPAPWKAVNREILEDESVYPCSIVGGDDEKLVCLLESTVYAELAIAHPDTFWASNKADSANARLIAAAPELLEALQTARSIVLAQNGNRHDDTNKAIAMFDAAIAKATGEQA